MRISQFGLGFACANDEAEINELVSHSHVGTTEETRADTTPFIALGIAHCRADIEPERNQ